MIEAAAEQQEWVRATDCLLQQRMRQCLLVGWMRSMRPQRILITAGAETVMCMGAGAVVGNETGVVADGAGDAGFGPAPADATGAQVREQLGFASLSITGLSATADTFCRS